MDGAGTATSYFIDMVSTALNVKRLPHFFYSNNNLQVMLPDYPCSDGRSLKYDLFRGISHEALNQAKLSLQDHLTPNLSCSVNVSGDDERNTVLSEFRSASEEMNFF